MKKIVLPLLLVLICYSCIKDEIQTGTFEGYKPVYIDKTEAFIVKVSSPAVLENPGKMYLYNNYIYIVDNGKGVHIVNNIDPANPQKIKFIAIPGVVDCAVKNDVLYADNITDLIALDISDLANINVSKRIKNIYPLENQLYPDFVTGYFECVDTLRGYVLRWEKAMLTNPKCYR